MGQVTLNNTGNNTVNSALSLCSVTPVSTMPVSFDALVPKKAFDNFEVWEVAKEELKNLYSGFVFTIEPTTEQLVLLQQQQHLRSNAVNDCILADIEFFQQQAKLPKVKKPKTTTPVVKATKSQQGKRGSAVSHGKAEKSLKPIDVHNRKLKDKLMAEGWSSRMANSVMKEAKAFVKGKMAWAKEHVKVLKKKFKASKDNVRKNELQSQIQFYTEQSQGEHITIGAKELLKKLSNVGAKLKAFETTVSLTEGKKLTDKALLEELVTYDALVAEKEQLQAKFQNSKLHPLTQMGSKDEYVTDIIIQKLVFTGNKTMYLRSVAGKHPNDEPTYFLEVKQPHHMFKDKKHGSNLALMSIPVRITQRNRKLHTAALDAHKAVKYTITFEANENGTGERLVCHGTYKVDRIDIKDFKGDRSLAIDQNAGFITLAIIERIGTQGKVLFLKKYKLPQTGSEAERAARLVEVVKLIVNLALEYRTNIVIEDINLVGKKTNSKKANYKVHNIPYSQFQERLGKMAGLLGVQVVSVNPAFSSVLAKVSYPSLNVHLGAAIILARRHLGLKEEIIHVDQQAGTCEMNLQGITNSPKVSIGKEVGRALQSKCRHPWFWAWLLTQVGKQLKADLVKVETCTKTTPIVSTGTIYVKASSP